MAMRSILLILLACFASPLAAADWHRAESETVVIHAKLDEAEIRELALLAEDFARLLNRILPAQVRSGRRLEIYLEETSSRISRISDFNNLGRVGAWPEMAGAFGVYDPGESRLTRNHTLFYAIAGHHVDNGFLRPNPPWVRTGVQLFFSTTYISEEGDFILGAPDTRRPMRGTMDAAKLTLLLSSQAAPRTQSAWGNFYDWSREAMFPMLIEPDNAGMLETYLDAYGKGVSLEEAGTALGDLDRWARQVRDRQNARRPTFRRVVLDPAPQVAVTVRPMTEDEVLLTDMRFERLRPERVETAAGRLSQLTERFPDSALVWAEYAAAEFARVRAADFGGEEVFRGFGFSNGEIIVTANPYSDAAAWRAVNRALALDPALAQAVELKAEILMNRLVRAGDPEDTAAFDEVRAMLAPLASLAEQRPMAAALYHQSYVEQGITPPPQAVEQLGRAFVANPGVEAFRYAYAVALARSGYRAEATRLLSSMLNHPDYSAAARRALEQVP